MLPSVLPLLLLAGFLQTTGVVGNPDSRLYHRPDLPHTQLIENPVSFSTREAAEEAGYRPCHVCYYPSPPSIRAIQEELMLGAQIDAQVRLYYPKWENPEAETEILEALERVLTRWPVPLKGYRYRVSLLDTHILNAVAIPAGQVYMTRGLWQTLESDEELEAVLALQIAHIEGRHGLRSWENSQGVGTLARLIGGIVSAPAGLDLSRVINYAKKVVIAGYSRGFNERAESFVLATLDSEAHRKGARQIFTKIADINAELEKTRSFLTAIPVTVESLNRFRDIRMFHVDATFTSAVPRTRSLNARLTVSKIVCNPSGCQIFGWLEILDGLQSTQTGPMLYLLDPAERGGAPMELIAENRAGATISWRLGLIEKQLGTTTALGNRAETNDIQDFLIEEIRSISLVFQYTTAPGGNPIGNRLVLTRSPGETPEPEGR